MHLENYAKYLAMVGFVTCLLTVLQEDAIDMTVSLFYSFCQLL